MRRILYITSTLKPCAPTTQLLYILRGLNREIFDPFILTLSPELETSAAQQFATLNVKIESLSLSRFAGMVFGKRELKRVLEKIQPDLVHSSGFRADLFAAAVNPPTPTVVTLRNVPFEDYPMKFGRFLGLWMARKHRKALSRIVAIVPCSYSIAGSLENFGFNFHVVQDGIDTDYFRPASPEVRNRIRSDWGTGPDEKVFLSVGSLIPRKDPITLIRGFLESPIGQKHKLFVLGNGPLWSACQNAAGNCTSVRMFGHVENVRPFLQGADYYVSASHSEGLPNAVLEAMACGLPAALSDIPSHREQVQFSPGLGHFFEVGDFLALGNCLDRLAKTGHEEHSAAAIALVKKQFSARRMSLEYQSLYNELIHGSPAA